MNKFVICIFLIGSMCQTIHTVDIPLHTPNLEKSFNIKNTQKSENIKPKDSKIEQENNSIY